MLVVVGGHSRNIGKTSVVAGLIRRLRDRKWTAVKITQYGHGVCSNEGKSCECSTEPEHPFAAQRRVRAQPHRFRPVSRRRRGAVLLAARALRRTRPRRRHSAKDPRSRARTSSSNPTASWNSSSPTSSSWCSTSPARTSKRPACASWIAPTPSSSSTAASTARSGTTSPAASGTRSRSSSSSRRATSPPNSPRLSTRAVPVTPVSARIPATTSTAGSRPRRRTSPPALQSPTPARRPQTRPPE